MMYVGIFVTKFIKTVNIKFDVIFGSGIIPDSPFYIICYYYKNERG